MGDPLITPAIIGANCLIGLVAGPVSNRADWVFVAGARKVGGILRLGTPKQNHHIMRATLAAYVEAMRDMANACAVVADDGSSKAAAKELSALTRRGEFKDFRYDGEHFPLADANAAIDRMFSGGIASIDGGGSEAEHRAFGRAVVQDIAVWGITLSEIQTRLFTDGIGEHAPWHLRFRIAFGEELIRDVAARSIFTQERLGEIRSNGIVLIDAIGDLATRLDQGFEAQTREHEALMDVLSASTRETHGKLDDLEQLLGQVYARGSHAQTPRAAFGAHADDGVGTIFSLAAPNSIIVGWYAAPGDWWEKVGRSLNGALDRLSGAGLLVPQHWDFCALKGSLAAPHAQEALWRPLSTANSTHIATIVHIGNYSSPFLPVDGQFERRLAKLGYLAAEAGARGFIDARHLDVLKRHAMVDAGAIPITAETRLIAETMLAERPLVVWDGSGSAKAPEVEALLAWLRDNNVAVLDGARVTDSDDSWALGFVAEIFGIRADQIPNPYRKLDHYSPGDAGNYYGRDAQADVARTWLQDALNGSAPACLRIGGSSGVGKSSFLNARLAPMARERWLTYVTFRPTDFDAAPNAVFSPIRDFCRVVEDAVGKSACLDDHPLIKARDLDKARSAAAKWIASLRKAGIRLLIGIDQFEEILDNIQNGWNREAWSSLLDLLSELPSIAGTVLAITLETSRETILERDYADTLYGGARIILLEDGQAAFLRQVITEPFAAAGFKLGEDVVNALITDTQGHQADIGNSSSALPLLSLRLYGLFDHLCQKRALPTGTVSGSFGGATGEITLDELEDVSLSIAEEISNLANQAWIDAGSGTQDDLDQFIRPYVRVVPTENGSLSRIVLQAVPQRGFYSMANGQSAFIRRRLLVPTATGFRLVHESVIRRWSMAAAWLEQERESLLRQTALANDAMRWHAKGRPALIEPSAEDIALAARFLMASVMDWLDHDDLPDATAIEREYYLALFSHADDPRTEVPASAKGSTYIYLAACYGMLDLLERFLAKDREAINLERKGDRGTPLMGASWTSATVVAKLLEWGANPNVVIDTGFMPVDAAIWGGQQAVFDLLLPLTDPVLASEMRSNPLYSAACRNRRDMMDGLERVGFRHDAPAQGGTTPLLGAASGSSVQMFEYCLGRGNVLARDARGFNVFDIAAARGNLAFQRILIEHPDGLDALVPNPYNGTTALMLAGAGHMAKTMAFLLQAGVDPNAQMTTGEEKGRTALHFCLDWLSRWKDKAPRYVIEKTRAALEALLASETIDVGIVSGKGETAYGMLVHHEDMRALIAEHPTFQWSNLPASMETPIERAIADKDRALVDHLLQDHRHRRVIDRVNAAGGTPSSAMIDNNMADLVVELIAAGLVSPWREASNYQGLLPAALATGDDRLVRLILEHMPERLTPGQLATLVNCKIVYGEARGFDLDDAVFGRALAAISNAADLTPALEKAGQLGNTTLVVRLIEAGAEFWNADDWGRTILDRAADGVRNAPAVVAAVRKHQELRKWTVEKRAILARGDLQQIGVILAQEPEGAMIDSWGRHPADLVPDSIQDEVRRLAGMSKEERG